MRLPDPQRSRAVLIGTGKYADGKLPNLPVVGRTIGDLAAALTDPVYGIIPKNNCTVLKDEADIRLIGRRLRSAASEAEDLLLVFFVGHGLVGARRHDLYLGLPDSEWADPEFTSLEYDKLRSSVLDSTAATKIIILDCCFSGRVVSEAMADPVTEMVGQIDVDGTYVLTSAERDKVALIRPGENYTAFSGRFLDLIRNGVPGGPEFLTVDYLYRQLMMRMKAEGLSQPQKRGTSTADLLALAGNRAFAAARPDARDVADTEIPRVAATVDPLSIPSKPGYYQGDRLADWGQRVVAHVIDWLPIIPGIVIWSLAQKRHWWGIVVIGVLATFGPWLYNRWYRQGRTGQSWGKWAMNLKLIRMLDKKPIDWWRAALRDLVHAVGLLMLFIGFLLPIIDVRRQTPADKMLDTVVIFTGRRRSFTRGKLALSLSHRLQAI